MIDQLKPYRVYIEEELLSGKSQQEVFNEVMDLYDIKIHEAAEAIRKTPTAEKRNKCRKLNNLLLIIIGVLVITTLGLTYMLNASEGKENYTLVSPSIVSLMLLYGLIKFKNPAHLIAGILFTVLSVVLAVVLILNFDIVLIPELILTLTAAVLAFSISSKLSSEYIYHREKVQNDPSLRIDTVTFIK